MVTENKELRGEHGMRFIKALLFTLIAGTTLMATSALASAPKLEIVSNTAFNTLTPKIEWRLHDGEQHTYQLIVRSGSDTVYELQEIVSPVMEKTIALPSEGKYDVELTVTDKNDEEVTATWSITADLTLPLIEEDSIRTNPENVQEWLNEPVELAIQLDKIVESGSGILLVETMLSGSTTRPWTSYTDPITITQEGETVVSIRVTDGAGNQAIKSIVVRLDQSAPSVPRIKIDAVRDQQTLLTINHGVDILSGVFKSQYRIGLTGEWIDYSAPVTIKNEVSEVIYARSIDHAGNISDLTTHTIEPITDPNTSELIKLDPSNWTNRRVTVTISEEKGPMEYRIGEDGRWRTYERPFTVSDEGRTTIFARLRDDQNHIESAVVRIDRTAPTVSIYKLSHYGWSITPVTVTVEEGKDAHSGVEKVQYRIGTSGSWIDYTNPFVINNEGTTYIYFRSVDHAGNRSATSQAIIRMLDLR